jgi:proteasome inhibitor subunit 1 (PI31)
MSSSKTQQQYTKPTMTSILQEIKTLNPKLTSAHEALALAIHVIMLQSGFRCVGIGEKGQTKEGEKLPAEWNASSDVFSFKYKHSLSQMTFCVKCLVLGDSLLVSGFAIEDQKPHTITIDVNSFCTKKTVDSIDTFFKDLDKLVDTITSQIVTRLVPLDTSQYQETVQQQTQQTQQTQQPQAQRIPPPSQPPLRPPLQDDPLRIGPIRGPGLRYPPVMPSIGDSDLHPYIPPMPNMPRTSPFGTGNLMGPNHPYFQQQFRPGRGRGIPNVPPGARFDPMTPFGTFPSEPNPDHQRMPRFREDDDDENPYFL